MCLLKEKNGEVSLIEINSETDFVAKNNEFISFCKEVSNINFDCKADIKKINLAMMKNSQNVENSLIDLIAKIGEKITIRRVNFFNNKNGFNFFYTHSSIEENIGKIISIVKISGKDNEVGKKIAMHISATSPISLTEESISKDIIDKELEIIKAELQNSDKKPEIIEKIAQGKIKKFISDNTLVNQEWIMDPKKKVSDILKESGIQIIDYIRYKVGEGV